jgi:uncharacterized protein with NRDE domain
VQPARGALVVVTNVRSADGPDPAKRSRGGLVCDLLTGTGHYAAPAPEQLEEFNGFSLITLNGGAARLMTNRPVPAILPLEPGIHALANEAADVGCPRAARLAEAVQGWATGGGAPTGLFDLLTMEAEPALFLRNPVYGTRCSTLVAVGADGWGRITERRYDQGSSPAGETAIRFRLFRGTGQDAGTIHQPRQSREGGNPSPAAQN